MSTTESQNGMECLLYKNLLSKHIQLNSEIGFNWHSCCKMLYAISSIWFLK